MFLAIIRVEDCVLSIVRVQSFRPHLLNGLGQGSLMSFSLLRETGPGDTLTEEDTRTVLGLVKLMTRGL
jgi:hypothetical protein